MRDIEEILENRKILKVYKNIKTDKILKLKVDVHSMISSDKCLCSLSYMEGWEHLSVSHKNKIPSWLTMQEMKEIFFKDDEECFQLHPKADNYVNNNEYTLHIWRPTEEKLPIPPSIFVGFRNNHIEEDAEECKKLHEKIGQPLSDEELKWLVMSATPEGLKELEKLMKKDPETLLKLSAKMGII